MERQFWYTFSTDVLAYSSPFHKFVIGIVGLKTADTLEKSDGFFLMPSDGTRHDRTIFKDSISYLYDSGIQKIARKANSVWNYSIDYHAKVKARFTLNLENEHDKEFLKLMSPLYTWKYDHVLEYFRGETTTQRGTNVGTIALVLLRVYKNRRSFDIEYKPVVGDSTQVRVFEIENQLEMDFKSPIHNDVEFDEFQKLVNYLREKTIKL